jgi:hypothetical protein
LTPESDALESSGFAVAKESGRFARRCRANVSGDMGGLAATLACPKAAEGTRLHITMALAMTNSLVEEKMRDRTAVIFRSFPEGEDPRRAEIIAGLLERLHDEVLRHFRLRRAVVRMTSSRLVTNKIICRYVLFISD